MDVSIPKRLGMARCTECCEVELALPPAQLATQRRQLRNINAARTQQEAVGALQQLEPVACLDAQGLENARRESHLAFGRDLHEHRHSSLPESYLGKAERSTPSGSGHASRTASDRVPLTKKSRPGRRLSLSPP